MPRVSISHVAMPPLRLAETRIISLHAALSMAARTPFYPTPTQKQKPTRPPAVNNVATNAALATVASPAAPAPTLGTLLCHGLSSPWCGNRRRRGVGPKCGHFTQWQSTGANYHSMSAISA